MTALLSRSPGVGADVVLVGSHVRDQRERERQTGCEAHEHG
jgi:hypothetical protein